MEDTPIFIKKKQLEIILSKTPEERFLMGLQMMEDVRQIALNSIRQAKPEISEPDLTIELMYRYYGKELSQEYLAAAARSIKGIR